MISTLLIVGWTIIMVLVVLAVEVDPYTEASPSFVFDVWFKGFVVLSIIWFMVRYRGEDGDKA